MNAIIHTNNIRRSFVHISRLIAILAAILAVSAHAGVSGRYVIFGNALSEKMGLVEVEVISDGTNVILNRPDVFTYGLDYGYWMMKRDHPERYAAMLVDGDKDTTQRKVDFGSKVSCGYLDIALRYATFEIDLGQETDVDRVGIYRSRHSQKQGGDLGWRYLVVLDEQRRIVAWEAFNAYGDGWRAKKGAWLFDLAPAKGAPAGRIVPSGARCWLSEAEYIRDFLGKSTVDLVSAPTEADAARLAAFGKRNSPAAIETLGRRFFRLVDLERPGMAEVKRCVQSADYAGAFDAFRKPFLETASILKHWNAGEGTSIYTFYAWTGEQDTRATLRARDLRNHVYADRDQLCVKRFVPGLMPPAKIQFPFQTRPLLLSYAANNTIEDLRLWETLTEDWAMGFQQAADNDPALRDHFVLNVGLINQTCKDLYMAAQTNPDFAEQVSGATLARLLMPLMEELPVSYWRVTRKCVFNHNFNAVAGAFLASQVLADFHVGHKLEREVCQALERLHTYAQYRDGPMVETCDEGHFVMNVISPGNLYGMLAKWRPAWFTPALERYFLDNHRQAVLAGIRHVSPGGAGIRWPNNTTRLEYLAYYLGTADPYWRNVTGMRMEWGDYDTVLSVPVTKEPEPRAIIDTVFGRGREYTDRNKVREQEQIAGLYGGNYNGPPTTVSDWLPYTGAFYFRRGWNRQDSFLHMLNPALGNSHNYGRYGFTGAYEMFWDTSYRFQDFATPLLTTFAADLDGQMVCPLDETRFFSGSKQDTFTQAVEKPQPSRWYTSDTLDFGEALYHGNYRTITFGKNEETGKREVGMSPAGIEDVHTVRQIFQVRQARLFLQIDRLRYATPDETHTNRIQTTLLLTEPGPDTAREFSDEQFTMEPDAHRVSMRNPGNPGATVAWFGQPDLSLKRISVNASSHHFWRTPDPETVDPAKDRQLFGPAPTLNGPRRTSGRGVIAAWQDTGETALITALYANRPGEEPITDMQDLSTDTVVGMRAETASGVVLTLLAARRVPAELSVDDITVQGEALLLVRVPGEAPEGIALDVETVEVHGQKQKQAEHDFAFTLADARRGLFRNDSGLRTHPIRRPIDPPTVGPPVNVFTETTQVTLTSTTPNVIIRYTTDGTDPTAKSRRYRRPFTIAEDTMVKARAFRRGIDSVPFTTAGTDVSAVSYGFFQKRPVKPAVSPPSSAAIEPGLAYDYLEGRWFALWSYTDILPATKSGHTDRLLDVSMRETDDPFALRYRGLINVPTTGVYTFYGPDEYINNTCAPGYDLRLYLDGEEWYLGQTWHGLGRWSVPLEKGLHTFMLTFADARARDIESQRIDLWRGYPQPKTTWRGTVPVLDVSGPGIGRQPIPNDWLKYAPEN
jgi:hypothetical protein